MCQWTATTAQRRLRAGRRAWVWGSVERCRRGSSVWGGAGAAQTRAVGRCARNARRSKPRSSRRTSAVQQAPTPLQFCSWHRVLFRRLPSLSGHPDGTRSDSRCRFSRRGPAGNVTSLQSDSPTSQDIRRLTQKCCSAICWGGSLVGSSTKRAALEQADRIGASRSPSCWACAAPEERCRTAAGTTPPSASSPAEGAPCNGVGLSAWGLSTVVPSCAATHSHCRRRDATARGGTV